MTLVQGPVRLATRGLGKRFGSSVALEAVDFDASGGEVHALTGANGAGKSTLMNLLAGVYSPTTGEIRIDGTPVQFDAPARARAAGVSAVYQELSVLPELTVAENVWLGHEPRARWGLLDRRALISRTAGLLEEYGLPLDPATPVGTLSIATRQLVEIARALSAASRILTLDEPTAVLSARERQRLFDIIARLKRRGLLVIFVSHRLDEVFEIADHITVLRNGQVVMSKATRQSDRAELIRQMVGHEFVERVRVTRPESVASPSIRISLPTAPVPVEIELARGEIVGLGGLVGAGRSRLARRLAGLDPDVEVHFRLEQEDGVMAGVTASVTGPVMSRVMDRVIRSPSQAIANGIVYLTEDRKRDGLFSGLPVLRNASAAMLAKLSRLGFINHRAERQHAVPVLERLKLVAASLQMPVHVLSGGNQQKVLFARALLACPIVLICDEPTRGVDVAAREQIYAVIESLAREGVTIVLIASDLKELLSLCHRVLVVRDAKVVAELPANATEGEIVDAALA